MVFPRFSVFSLLSAGFVLFFFLVLVAANAGFGQRYWAFLGDWPAGDKVGHFALFGTLAFLVEAGWRRRCFGGGDGGGRRRRFPVGIVGVAIFAVVEELSQAFLPTRGFDWWDMVASLAGVAAAWAAVEGVWRKKGKGSPMCS